MSQSERFDVVILGSGQGGKLLAWHLAGAGKTIAVVERRWVGGSCPAVACMPSKTEVWSARVAHLVRNATRFGTIAENVRTDMAQVRRHKQEMVDGQDAFHIGMYERTGAQLIMGSGRLVGPNTIEVALTDGGLRRLEGKEIVIDVGSHAAMPNIPGLSEAQPLTHVEALELDEVPGHVVVLGGGYTGVELAQVFRRLGSRVTIVEPGPRILSREDEDVAQEMARLLGNEGIEIVYEAHPLGVEGRSGQAVSVTVRMPVGERTIEGSHVLLATGRVPNTADIGLDLAGVGLTPRGFIEVDEGLRAAPGVWAIGECAGSPQFTHVAVDDFRIVRDNMAGGQRSRRDRLVPHVVFTDPPLARIGLSEREARAQGTPVRVAKLSTSQVLRTFTTDEPEGFLKVLVGAADDRILGFAMIGSEAGEVVAVIQAAMLAGTPYTTLRDAVFVHLTMAEGLGPLFEGVPARAA